MPVAGSRQAGEYRWFPRSKWARMALGVSVVRTAGIIALEAIVLANCFSKDLPIGIPSQDGNVIYHSILIVTTLFSTILAWDALVHKNTIQVMAVAGYDGFIIAYVGILLGHAQSVWGEMDVVDPARHSPAVETNRWLVLGVLILSGVTGVAMAFLTWEIFREFGWTVFKQLGADRSVRRMYKAYLRIVALLKIDIFFFVVYSVLTATLVTGKSQTSSWIQVGVAIPVAVLVISVGFYAVEGERPRVMFAFMGGCVATGGYLLYQIVRVTQLATEGVVDGEACTFLLFFSSIALVLIVVTVVCAGLSVRYFGRGLREHIERHKVRNQRRNSMLYVPRWDLASEGAEEQATSERWAIE